MRLIYVVALSATLVIVIPSGASSAAAETKTVAHAQSEKLSDRVVKALQELDVNLGDEDGDDEDLSEATRPIVQVNRKKAKLKLALIIYGIINSILWVAENALAMTIPPLGALVRFVDVVAGGVARKTLDEYYEEFVKAEHKAIQKYVEHHKDALQGVKAGQKYQITTPKGPVSGKLRRLPTEDLRREDLQITNLNVVKFLAAANQLKKKR